MLFSAGKHAERNRKIWKEFTSSSWGFVTPVQHKTSQGQWKALIQSTYELFYRP